MELDHGVATDWHFHTQVADFFVGLTGVVEVQKRDPEKKMQLLPGQYLQLDPKQVHRVTNIGEGKAEYLLVQGIGTYDFCKV
jgi:quercetin dioxygenase-like cupin family protein